MAILYGFIGRAQGGTFTGPASRDAATNADQNMSGIGSYDFIPAKPFPVPAQIMGRGPKEPHWYRWLTSLVLAGRADTVMREAQPQPVRMDTFNQLAASTGLGYVAGGSPTSGIYTGLGDEPCLTH